MSKQNLEWEAHFAEVTAKSDAYIAKANAEYLASLPVEEQVAYLAADTQKKIDNWINIRSYCMQACQRALRRIPVDDV